MNDLISRSALIAFIKANGMVFANTLETFPAVDAVPVVRCKDCKWYEKSKRYGYYKCGNPCEGMAHGVELMPYDFCSYGERRNGDG